MFLQTDSKHIFHFVFFASLLLYLLSAGVGIWICSIFLYFGLLFFEFAKALKHKFPIGEIIALNYLIQNVLAIAILNIFLSNGYSVDQFYYCKVPVEDYIPFSFLSIQGLYIGYRSIKLPNFVWTNYFIHFKEKIKQEMLIGMLFIGITANILAAFQIPYVDYIVFILNSFFRCALIGFVLYGGKRSQLYLLIGVFFTSFQVIISGMLGEALMSFLYIALLFICKSAAVNRKINWVPLFFLGGVLFLACAYLQSIKGDYRAATWGGNQEASAETLVNVAKKSKTTVNPFDGEFYLPLFSRLNQGAIVSETLYRVPNEVKFENGATIVNALKDAFIPRFLNPEKEEAGGREKIRKYATRKLVKSTSMNIGLLGEGYINFGKLGCILFFLVYGILIGKLEKYLLQKSIHIPILMLLFPMYFDMFMGSEGDFLMLLNSLVKATIVIFILIEIFFSRYKVYRKDPIRLHT